MWLLKSPVMLVVFSSLKGTVHPQIKMQSPPLAHTNGNCKTALKTEVHEDCLRYKLIKPHE